MTILCQSRLTTSPTTGRRAAGADSAREGEGGGCGEVEAAAGVGRPRKAQAGGKAIEKEIRGVRDEMVALQAER